MRKGTLGYYSSRRKKWPKFQIRLSTLLLLMAVIGIWSGYFHAKRQLEAQRISTLAIQRINQTIYVDDPLQYAIAKAKPLDDDDRSQLVYLPAANRYEICYEARDALVKLGLDDSVTGSVKRDIAAGLHIIDFQKSNNSPNGCQVLVDGHVAFERSIPLSWPDAKQRTVSLVSTAGWGNNSKQLLTIYPLVVREAGLMSRNSYSVDSLYSVWIQKIQEDHAEKTRDESSRADP